MIINIIGGGYMCANRLVQINFSSPMRASPVALMRISPSGVKGRSVVLVCRPLSDLLHVAPNCVNTWYLPNEYIL